MPTVSLVSAPASLTANLQRPYNAPLPLTGLMPAKTQLR